MSLWNSLRRRFPYARGAQARQALAEAYLDVFVPRRTASEAQKQMVLADLANASGFYRVSGPEMSGETRAFMDGMRAVYGRVFRFLHLSEQEVRELEEAARQEAIADSEQGEI